VERTPFTSDSLQSSSSQYSKHSTEDNNQEEEEEEDQREESRKRARSDKNRNFSREMSSLRTTVGFPPFSLNVGGRRGKN
jgi:hypothetical protein